MNSETIIYINRQIDRAFLLSLTGSIGALGVLGAGQDEVETNLAKITLEKNPYASDPRLLGNDDAFLRYPHRLVVEAKQSPPSVVSPIKLSANDVVFDPRGYEAYIEFVSKLLQALRKSGISAVAACDFEHMLPDNSGENSRPPAIGSSNFIESEGTTHSVILRKFTCPCCGYPELEHPPYKMLWVPPIAINVQPPYWQPYGEPSYEVCDCCGFEFGYDDEPGTAPPKSFADFLKEWVDDGCIWFNPGKKPPGWNLEQQQKKAGMSFSIKAGT